MIQGTETGRFYKLADPLDLDCERAGLLGMEHEPDQLQDIFGNAGFDGATGVDSAIRNNCMLSAGFSMLAESDDSYNEV